MKMQTVRRGKLYLADYFENACCSPRCLRRMHHGAIGRPPNTVLAHRMYLTPERFNEIAPAGNLRDYNPGIEIQSRRWKRNGRGLSRTRIQVYARCDGATGGLKGWLDNKLKFASRFSLSGMTASHSRVGPPRCLSHLVG